MVVVRFWWMRYRGRRFWGKVGRGFRKVRFQQVFFLIIGISRGFLIKMQVQFWIVVSDIFFFLFLVGGICCVRFWYQLRIQIGEGLGWQLVIFLGFQELEVKKGRYRFFSNLGLEDYLDFVLNFRVRKEAESRGGFEQGREFLRLYSRVFFILSSLFYSFSSFILRFVLRIQMKVQIRGLLVGLSTMKFLGLFFFLRREVLVGRGFWSQVRFLTFFIYFIFGLWFGVEEGGELLIQ